MVKATYAGQSFGLDIDKQQEKTLIYIAAGIVLFIIGYILYKAISTVEAITNTPSQIMASISDTINQFSQKTDLQTINEVFGRYDIKYTELTPEVQSVYQQMLGSTKAYYEQYETPMTFDAFVATMGTHAQSGGYGEGFTGETTISRALIPADYTGTYYAGKLIV